ncbi:hypothetical protein BH11ARM2_BH11ARM2_25690 [soil metagenome]
MQAMIPIWIAVGGTPESVVRAGRLGLPMGLAIIGGAPRRFARLVRLYREAAEEAGHDADALPVGINMHGYIADTTQRAADEFYPAYAQVMDKLGRERGWPPTSRDRYEAERSSEGALLVGSPQEVADKLLAIHEIFGNARFLIQFSVGTMSHAKILRSIELYGTQVAPAVRKALA